MINTLSMTRSLYKTMTVQRLKEIFLDKHQQVSQQASQVFISWLFSVRFVLMYVFLHVLGEHYSLALNGGSAFNSYNLMLTNLLLYLTNVISHEFFIRSDTSFSPSARLKMSREKSVSREKPLHGILGPFVSRETSPLTYLYISKIQRVSVVTNVQINLCVAKLRCSYAANHLLYDTGSMAVCNGTPLTCYLLIALALIGTSTSAAWSLVDPIWSGACVTRPVRFRLLSHSCEVLHESRGCYRP